MGSIKEIAEDGRSSAEIQKGLEELNPEGKPEKEIEHQYPSLGRIWIAMSALYVTMFLVALVSPKNPQYSVLID